MGIWKKMTKRLQRARKDMEHRRKLRIKWILPSGLTVNVEDQGEWLIYNDIFVDGEYNFPIEAAFGGIPPKEMVTVVDVGANVGFFTLKAADWLLRNLPAVQSFRFICIEGSPTVFKKLQRRLMKEDLLAGHVTLIHGLVGEREGKGEISEKPFHAMNRVDVLAKSRGKGEVVPYVDLPLELADIPEIDLLKCDIEGSELDLLEGSPELFAKVRMVVIELHDYNCDTERCRQIFKEMDFVHRKTIRSVPGSFSLELYSRAVGTQ